MPQIPPPFAIKICGVTRIQHAQAVLDGGADAIGLNFYSRSKRFIDFHVATEICKQFSGRLKIVGLFVDASPAEVLRVSEQLSLDAVQLHGEEAWSQEWQELARQVPLIRAFRWPPSDATSHQFVSQWTDDAVQPDLAAYLVDANVAGQLGGTGQVTDWQSLNPRPAQFGNRPLILAGGLKPENVAQAIAIAAPNAIDTAGGVESGAGHKDPKLIARFVAEVAKTFGRVHLSSGSRQDFRPRSPQ